MKSYLTVRSLGDQQKCDINSFNEGHLWPGGKPPKKNDWCLCNRARWAQKKCDECGGTAKTGHQGLCPTIIKFLPKPKKVRCQICRSGKTNCAGCNTDYWMVKPSLIVAIKKLLRADRKMNRDGAKVDDCIDNLRREMEKIG